MIMNVSLLPLLYVFIYTPLDLLGVLWQSGPIKGSIISWGLSHRNEYIKGNKRGSKLTERYLASSIDLNLTFNQFMKPQYIITVFIAA